MALLANRNEASIVLTRWVEDLIADRMGQYASGTARDRIDQARTLLALHPDADMAYLERPSTSSG